MVNLDDPWCREFIEAMAVILVKQMQVQAPGNVEEEPFPVWPVYPAFQNLVVKEIQ